MHFQPPQGKTQYTDIWVWNLTVEHSTTQQTGVSPHQKLTERALCVQAASLGKHSAAICARVEQTKVLVVVETIGVVGHNRLF